MHTEEQRVAPLPLLPRAFDVVVAMHTIRFRLTFFGIKPLVSAVPRLMPPSRPSPFEFNISGHRVGLIV